MTRALALALALASCTPSGVTMSADHPANPEAPIGRLAGPPIALRLGVAERAAPEPPTTGHEQHNMTPTTTDKPLEVKPEPTRNPKAPPGSDTKPTKAPRKQSEAKKQPETKKQPEPKKPEPKKPEPVPDPDQMPGMPGHDHQGAP